MSKIFYSIYSIGVLLFLIGIFSVKDDINYALLIGGGIILTFLASQNLKEVE